MSDKEMQISEEELKGIKLKEASTKAQQTDMNLVLKCNDGKTIPWPICCGELMELEGNKLMCHDKSCGKSMEVPECSDGEKAKPFISKA